ncbi:MAG TPA: winged helix DNA-binding domain-containing protein [Natronosporangium sp.]
MSTAGELASHLPDIAQQRLRNQRLTGARLPGITEVVGWFGAVQSQEYAVAKWSVGERATGSTDAALDRALADGTIIRTHVPRGTWHFINAEDVRWLIELTGPRVHTRMATYYRQQGLDSVAFDKCHRLLVDLLSGGNQLTRKELATAIIEAGIAADNFTVGFLLIHAELEQVVCSGGLKGKQRTYALFDERVPPAPPRDRDEALADLVRRYFTSHGPATRADFQWWSGLVAADAKRGLALVGADLVATEVDGQQYWSAPGEPPGRPEPSPTVHLLQAFDEYLVAYTGRRKAFDLAGLASVRDPMLHVVIVDGQFAGGWRRTLTADAMTIEVRPARPFEPAEQAALAAAVDEYAAFVGVPATLVVPDA